MPTVFTREGPWDAETRANPALRFIETYSNDITEDLSLPMPDTKYFSPSCEFYNATDITYHGAAAIKTWMQGLFAPFARLRFDLVRCTAIDDSEGNGRSPRYRVFMELVGAHWFEDDPEPIYAPRMMTFDLRQSVTEDGYEGLQYHSVRLYWNTALVATERRRRQSVGNAIP